MLVDEKEIIVAKLPAKFEDWTPPWANGTFDEDVAAKGVFNALKAAETAKEQVATLTAENSTLKTELQTATDGLATARSTDADKDAALNALKATNRELEKVAAEGRPEDRQTITKLQVAMKAGLTDPRDAARLVGETEEELTEDATGLATRFGISTGQTGDQSGSTEPPRRQPARDLGNGRQRGSETPQLISADELISKGLVGDRADVSLDIQRLVPTR